MRGRQDRNFQYCVQSPLNVIRQIWYNKNEEKDSWRPCFKRRLCRGLFPSAFCTAGVTKRRIAAQNLNGAHRRKTGCAESEMDVRSGSRTLAARRKA